MYWRLTLTGQDRQRQIKNRVDIDTRPVAAENREWLGHYEYDTMMTKITLVNRQTRKTKIKALVNRKAANVTQPCIDKLQHKNPLSITFDNGKELQAMTQ